MPTKKVQKKKFKFLRRTLRVLFGIFIFFGLLILFIRSPWGQSIIVDKAINFVSGKTNTKVSIDKMFITFNGSLQLEGLFLEDKKGDTLIYSKSLEANIPLWSMIKGDAVGVDNLDWEGLRANIVRKDSVSGYNFQFLIDTFATDNNKTVPKETKENPLNIVIGKLDFKNINLVFNDEVLGINSKFKIGNLTTNMEKVDLQKMIFTADEVLLSDSNINFIQKSVITENTAEKTPLPILSANNITLNNVNAYYESQADKMIADVKIDHFYTEIPKIDLVNNNIKVNTIQLKNSEILFKTNPTTTVSTSDKKTKSNFIWPELTLQVDAINLENNKIQYFVNKAKIRKNIFNPNAISLDKLNLKIATISLKNKKASINLEELNFKEKSGFRLKELALEAQVTDSELEVSNLNVTLNKSKITGFANAKYKSLSQLISSPEKTKIKLVIPFFTIWLDEFFTFQPSLKQNEYLTKLSKKELFGKVNVSGVLSDLNIYNTNIDWGLSTKIAVNGNIKNSTNPDLLQLNFPKLKAETKRVDLLQIIDEKELNVRLPEEILITGNVKGSLKNINLDAKVTTSQGLVNVNGIFKNENNISFDANAALENYNVGKLLMNPDIGELSATLNSKGNGENINNLEATLETNISKFQVDKYTIKDLKIEGNIKDGKGNVISNYKDENLNLKLNAFVELDSIASKANVNIDVVGADLEGLGLMKRNVKTGMDLSLDFKGNLKKYSVKSNIKNGVFIYDNRTYLIGPLTANGFVDKDTTAVSIKNKMLDLNLESNTDPLTFSKALQRHLLSYFYRDTKVSDTIINPVNFQLKAKISQTSLIKDVFLVNIKEIDTIKIAVDFNEKERKLIADITAPHINYSGNTLDSLAFSMHTDKENFNFDLGFKNITAGPLNVPKTIITGNQKNNELSLNFLGFYQGKKLMNVNTKITGNRDRLSFTVKKDSLVLNSGSWDIPENNEIILTENKLTFSDFKISKDNQSIEITDKNPSISKNHIAINYKNFEISEVFNYLNPEKEITTGILNGDFVLEQPFTDTGVIADLSISQLQVLKKDFGKFSVDAKSLGNNRYDFNAKLNGGDVDLGLKGDYFVSNNDANLNLDLIINEFKMNALKTLSFGEIKETAGSFSGAFKVTGTTSEPKYKGNLKFSNADFKVTKLNTKFTLKDETLKVDNSGLTMSNFTILDAKKNTLKLSGKIKTESFINPKFNLDIKANNFRVLNASKEDNKFLYGKVAFNADVKLTGDLQIPKLNAQLTLASDTDVTYVMPSAYANIEERDGIVAFVNRKNPDAILTQTEEQTATITGFDIFAQLKVGKQAAINIVINEDTGDNFRVLGEGDFIFTMIPNGRLSLTGVYDVSEGHYELNLYELVTRKFSLAPGSRVTWLGDPFDAKLEVKAIYNLKTSVSPLMASQISGEDSAIKNKYKQEFPFNVYLNINGELLQPKISFNIDMPEDEQGAIGGQVYGRVQQVNQQEDELNRQVFSLLVLNRFYPDAGSDGSSGGFATIARGNLDDAVSGQLNAFSDKILGSSGIELDFGLNSFTDYQGDAPTDRTQLDIAAQKKLFNDRLIVRVGSEVDIQGSSANGETTPLIGNVSLEYKITEDGRYRIRGFRKSEFENVIDGQTIVSGIALIFTKEFNEFSELWNSILRAQKAKKKAKEVANRKENKVEKSTKNIDEKRN